MGFQLIGRLTGMALLAMGLAACVDVDIDIAVTGPGTARATMTQTMGSDLYAMVKMNAESADSEEPGFCEEPGAQLSENDDGSASCVLVEEGPFAELDLGQDEGGVRFSEAGPGLVRIALPTADMKSGMGLDEDLDEQTQAMVSAFFEGHDMTISFSGAEVVETNMTRSADGRSASQVIPLLDLINAALELPEELFAVVRTP